MTSSPSAGVLLILGLAGASSGALAADAFGPVGAKATISVEYLYESEGSKAPEKYDSRVWRVRRSVTITGELASHAATAVPTVQPIDANQMAQLKGLEAKSQLMAGQMAPMMGHIEKIMAKCGHDEACITRETQKLGFGMQGTPDMEAARKTQKNLPDLQPGAPRYQAWRQTAQKGSYAIDETVHIVFGDPVCPDLRCTRDETRKGGGDLPLRPPSGSDKEKAAAAVGFSAIEVDNVRKTLSLVLPAPLLPLPFTEIVKTNLPQSSSMTGQTGLHAPPSTQQKLHSFRLPPESKPDKPFTVPIKGDWRSQAGEQVAHLKGNFGEAGKLTVRWRFQVQ